jgi:type IX secretion system PorP/SprF family membrane protein
MRYLILGLIVSLFSSTLFAQQLPQISFKHQNVFLHNPAGAGSNPYNEVKILHREQWVGFENAPSTSLISYNQKLGTSSGIGGFLIHDRTFPTSRLIVNLSYAYIIEMDKLNFSFGLSGMIMQYRFKNESITYRDPLDPSLQFNAENKWRPEANAGIMVQNNKFYVSFAVNQILQSGFSPFSAGDLGLIKNSRSVCISGQYHIKLENHIISPGLYFTYAKSSPLESDVSVSYTYNSKVFASIAHRWQDVINISVGYNFDIFSLGYSCDIITSSLRVSTSSSHEIMLTIDISKKSESSSLY